MGSENICKTLVEEEKSSFANNYYLLVMAFFLLELQINTEAQVSFSCIMPEHHLSASFAVINYSEIYIVIYIR